jgi:hypothetical protein
MQPTGRGSRLSSGPSLILHGRTEIKARALVLGEVSVLSFSRAILQHPAFFKEFSFKKCFSSVVYEVSTRPHKHNYAHFAAAY